MAKKFTKIRIINTDDYPDKIFAECTFEFKFMYISNNQEVTFSTQLVDFELYLYKKGNNTFNFSRVEFDNELKKISMSQYCSNIVLYGYYVKTEKVNGDKITLKIPNEVKIFENPSVVRKLKIDSVLKE